MRESDHRVLMGGWMLPLLALALANVVVAVLWTWPVWSSRSGATGRDDELATASRVIEPRLEEARATYGRVAQAAEDLAELRRRMRAPGSATLVRVVQTAAEDAGLSVEETRFQPAALEDLGLMELGMTVPVRGSYAAVRRLVETLAATPEFLVIRGVTLSTADAVGAGASGGEGLLVDLTMSAFLDDGALSGLSGGAAGADTASTESPWRPGPAAGRGSPAHAGDTGDAVDPGGSGAAGSGIDPVDRARELAGRLESLPPLPLDPAAFRVELRRLDRAPSPAAEPRRNLFTYDVPAPAPPPVEVPEETAPGPQEVEEPPPPVRLVGIMTVDGSLRASLTDGIDIFVGAAGSVLSNGYRIVDIGNEHVEVDTGERRVRLVLEDPGS